MSETTERIFMNTLLKHTVIALAIIVPLAAINAYAGDLNSSNVVDFNKLAYKVVL